MIHYQLCCASQHEFDGWFKDSTAFERQEKRGLISCPVCADTQVTRALMAPGLKKKGRMIEAEQVASPQSAPSTSAPVQAAGGVMPDQIRSALHRLRADVEKNCDYVGPKFADEARRIQKGESKPRGIYGESTDAEVEALADDGIEIARMPWLPRADS